MSERGFGLALGMVAALSFESGCREEGNEPVYYTPFEEPKRMLVFTEQNFKQEVLQVKEPVVVLSCPINQLCDPALQTVLEDLAKQYGTKIQVGVLKINDRSKNFRSIQSPSITVFYQGVQKKVFRQNSQHFSDQKVKSLVEASLNECFSEKEVNWKAVLVSGQTDQFFDKYRERFARKVASVIPSANIRQLTADSNKVSGNVASASIASLENALKSLHARSGDGCFIYLDSHGLQGSFDLGYDTLLPTQLNKLLVQYCGELPTLVVIGSCHSGSFLETLKGKNRIIFTGAKAGESSTSLYTDCLIKNFTSKMKFSTLFDNTNRCLKVNFTSNPTWKTFSPQIYIGSGVKKLRIPSRKKR